MKLIFGFFLLSILSMSFAFMYPEERKIKTGVMIYKYRQCPHDCMNEDYLNQHDAYLCPQDCHYF